MSRDRAGRRGAGGDAFYGRFPVKAWGDEDEQDDKADGGEDACQHHVSDPDAPWVALHHAKLPGWYVGQPSYNEHHVAVVILGLITRSRVSPA